MKRVAANKNPRVVSIPEVVRMAIRAIQPTTVVIAFDVEHVEVAV